MRYFSSDLHFYDEGLMKNCDRPFSSVEEMHRKIIDNFRNKVDGDGEVYILGDLMGKNSKHLTKENFINIFDQMGINNPNTPFHLILGNNDTLQISDYMDMGFKSVKETDNITLGEFSVMLVHDPCMVQKKNTLALCGHIHTLFEHVYNAQRNTLAINVGIEIRNYAPLSEEEIVDLIKNTPWNKGA